MANEDNPLYINAPYFDLVQAENFGFDIETFQLEGFGIFITKTILCDFIRMRKSFIARDIIDVRFIAHKFKGCFR